MNTVLVKLNCLIYNRKSPHTKNKVILKKKRIKMKENFNDIHALQSAGNNNKKIRNKQIAERSTLIEDAKSI